jgi:hypothetical protein
MKSKMLARRNKKSTVLVSSQTLERAIQEANRLADGLLDASPQDPRLEQLDEAINFLSSLMAKDPSQMQQDGVSTLEDYLDDAKAPEVARKVKQTVDMIQQMRSAQLTPEGGRTAPAPIAQPQPVTSSGSDNFITDREDGRSKRSFRQRQLYQ